jgi:hypothetical protein
MIDEFIGTERTTPKNSTLKVVGRESDGLRKYIFVCSICSVDEEMYPYGSLTISKGGFKEGNIPCGCSYSPKYSKAQQEIRVKRWCEIYNLTFKGWVCGYQTAQSRLILHSKTTGVTWENTSVTGLLRSKGDPSNSKVVAGVLRRGKAPALIQQFKETGAYVEGTVFNLNLKGGCDDWLVTCPVCSSDELSVEGLCSGTFKSKTVRLKAGKVPCRCNSNYQLNKEQYNYTCKYLHSSKGYKFERILPVIKGKINSRSLVEVTCPKGHLNITTTGVLINGKAGCQKCASSDREVRNLKLGKGYGFYPSRITENDYLYIVSFNAEEDKLLKVGRAFNVQERLKEFHRNNIKDFQVEAVLQGTHQDVFNAEQVIHKVLDKDKLRRVQGWTRETFDFESWGIVEDLLSLVELRSLGEV